MINKAHLSILIKQTLAIFKERSFCFIQEINQDLKMKKILKYSLVIINLAVLLIFGTVIYYNNTLPNNYYVTEGNTLKLSEIIETKHCSGTIISPKSNSANTNIHQAELSLLGLIPIKTVNIKEVAEPILVPCGNPFGIKLLTDGVIVVEVSSFETENGIKAPAYDAGIRTGDIIKTINGSTVKTNEDIEKIISKSNGSKLSFEIIRDNTNITLTATPSFCSTDNSYRIGLWVRDSSAGIGTITFYNPKTNVFAGLGHPVCDVDTGEILPLLKGEVVNVNINGIKKGKAGSPGELLGSFTSNSAIGTLEINSQNGLYGHISSIQTANIGIPLAMRQEIKTGKAYIYTTIDGNKPEKFEITIEKIDLNESSECKNMIIKVTDKQLLEKTGGIVQGMSGSPIIQNDKLVGAVTHVFVNNPTKGYAIFADTMYDCSLEVLNSDKAA